MVCQRDCINCGSEDDVKYVTKFKEYYCDCCIEMMELENE